MNNGIVSELGEGADKRTILSRSRPPTVRWRLPNVSSITLVYDTAYRVTRKMVHPRGRISEPPGSFLEEGESTNAERCPPPLIWRKGSRMPPRVCETLCFRLEAGGLDKRKTHYWIARFGSRRIDGIAANTRSRRERAVSKRAYREGPIARTRNRVAAGITDISGAQKFLRGVEPRNVVSRR